MAIEEKRNSVLNERELDFQFMLLEKNADVLISTVEHERAARTELQAQNNELRKQVKEQAELLKNQRQQVKEWAAKIKLFEKNQVSLTEKIQHLKEFSIIVKNPNNADAIAGLKEKLDDYIRYVDEAIQLLRTI